MQRAINQTRGKGSSHWFNALPIEGQYFKLNKGEFYDILRLRYNKQLKTQPSNFPCGSTHDVCHALSHGRGDVVIMRHHDIGDITASMLNEICKDVEIEPRLQPVTSEQMHYRTATSGDEARLSTKDRGLLEEKSSSILLYKCHSCERCLIQKPKPRAARELWKWKEDLLCPWFLELTEQQERSVTHINPGCKAICET